MPDDEPGSASPLDVGQDLFGGILSRVVAQGQAGPFGGEGAGDGGTYPSGRARDEGDLIRESKVHDDPS
jgi:hypothetical protein